MNREPRASGADSFVRLTNFTEHGRVAMPSLDQLAREE
jgi:hypothetical protein